MTSKNTQTTPVESLADRLARFEKAMLLKEGAEEPDDKSPEWWDEFERDLIISRHGIPTVVIQFDEFGREPHQKVCTITSSNVPGFNTEAYTVAQLRRHCAEVIELLTSGPEEPPWELLNARRIGRVRVCFEVELATL